MLYRVVIKRGWKNAEEGEGIAMRVRFRLAVELRSQLGELCPERNPCENPACNGCFYYSSSSAVLNSRVYITMLHRDQLYWGDSSSQYSEEVLR